MTLFIDLVLMKNKHCCLVLGKKFLREPSQWREEPSLKTARSFGLMIDLDGGTTVTIIKLIIITNSVDIFTINMMNIIITA